MSNINLSKIMEKILSKIRREKKRAVLEEKPTSELPSQDESEKLMGKIPREFYLKALPLKSIEDMNLIKDEVKSGNILIIQVKPLAKNSMDDLKHAISELCEFTHSYGGNIARLGEERIVITPSLVKIWHGKAGTSEAESTAA